jgi:energy-coupling factor transporter ATP-binding protein EcfA2
MLAELEKENQMIISIRGTSGSGKTTLVRSVLEKYPNKEPEYIQGRKQPIGYVMSGSSELRDCYVVGHYEAACGGCDTITSYEQVFEIVREKVQQYPAVLFEGLLLTAENKRSAALAGDYPDTHFVFLDVPLEQCIAQVNQRRWAKDASKPPVNPKNTASKHKGAVSNKRHLDSVGANTYLLPHADATAKVLELLHV